MSDDERRASLLALIEANHAFPGPFHFSVVAHNHDEVAVALRVLIESETGSGVAEEAWQTQPSARGTYISHRITVACDSADQVVVLFEKFHALNGVVRVL